MTSVHSLVQVRRAGALSNKATVKGSSETEEFLWTRIQKNTLNFINRKGKLFFRVALHPKKKKKKKQSGKMWLKQLKVQLKCQSLCVSKDTKLMP